MDHALGIKTAFCVVIGTLERNFSETLTRTVTEPSEP